MRPPQAASAEAQVQEFVRLNRSQGRVGIQSYSYLALDSLDALLARVAEADVDQREIGDLVIALERAEAEAERLRDDIREIQTHTRDAKSFAERLGAIADVCFRALRGGDSG